MNKVVSFDFWNTLYTSNPKFQNKQYDLCVQYVPQLTRAEWDKRRSQIKRKVDELAENEGKVIFRKEIYKELLPEMPRNQLDEFMDKSDSLFISFPPIPTILHSLVLELKSEGYRVKLSSNTVFISGDILAGIVDDDLSIQKSDCNFSDLLGCSKPDRRMFRFEMHPDFHVGDNLITDGACVNSGITFIHFDKNNPFSWTFSNGGVEFNTSNLQNKVPKKETLITKVRFSSHKFDELENLRFDIRDYSKLKYGSKRVARNFGIELATKFMCSPQFIGLVPDLKDRKIVVASAPSKSIAVASTAIKDYFISKFNPIWSEVYPAVEDLKIFRGHSYNEDYGAMTKEQRDAAITSDSFHIDKIFIEGKVLFLIDDVYITGSHERRMESLLEAVGFHGLVVFLYYAEYIGDGNPNIENDMNFAFVKSIKNIDHIIKNDEFIFNTRVVKYILNQPKEAFENFIDYQSEQFLHTFITFITGNEYHKLPEFRDNYLYLKSRS